MEMVKAASKGVIWYVNWYKGFFLIEKVRSPVYETITLQSHIVASRKHVQSLALSNLPFNWLIWYSLAACAQ